MRSLQVRKIGARELYDSYIKKPHAIDISRILFRRVCQRFNSLALNRMIEHQEVWSLGTGIGAIGITRVRRNYNTKNRFAINWKESNKLRQKYIDQGEEIFSKSNPNGKKWYVYFTEHDYYVKFRWIAYRAKYNPNFDFYKFTPARGAKKRLTSYLAKNPVAIHKFVKYIYP